MKLPRTPPPPLHRRVLVTGGTRGIGGAIVERFLTLESAVIVVSRSTPEAPVPGVEYWPTDLSSRAEVETLARRVAEAKVDTLINNAGITKCGPVEAITVEDILHVDQVNLLTPFVLSQAVLPYMRSIGWGRIVNIGSIFGLVVREDRIPYCVSKFALGGLTAALASECARDGILVNCVCPGMIDTELTRTVLGAAELEKMIAKVPMGRLGEPQEIANFVSWLASPENSFISGQSLAIDGGYTSV
jgi:NAD(P)-dependent dehydrogenase (short-subunit alcohol dehydrogenase family)